MITSKNIFYHELIGLYSKVIKSSNESLIGICGNIIDETKKTISIETDNNSELKIIPKDISVFLISLPNGEVVEIEGKILVSRPEDRIKKRYKKLY
jgi:ribonuclease P protein subunit POP4